MPAQPLLPLMEALENQRELPQAIWHEWLWGTDPEEQYHVDVLLNRNHLLALLVCRYKFLHQAIPSEPEAAVVKKRDDQQRMTIMDTPVHRMSWRELKDTLANILFEWPAFLDRLRHNIRAKQNLRQVMHLVNECACRFGALACTAAKEDLMDDPCETQPAHAAGARGVGGPTMLTLTPGALRRMAGSLLIMYRHLHLLSVCVSVPSQQNYDPGLSKYHYEASQDEFNLLCMHISIPVAARLNYRHDFPGMYNHVSQVVYFHNSQYVREKRHAIEGMQKAPAAHVLPAVQELYPEIKLRYEEDRFDPTVPGKEWYWLLLAGRVYLVTPEPQVLYSDNVCDLLKVFVEKTAANPREAVSVQAN
jgi:hypothetical protein